MRRATHISLTVPDEYTATSIRWIEFSLRAIILVTISVLKIAAPRVYPGRNFHKATRMSFRRWVTSPLYASSRDPCSEAVHQSLLNSRDVRLPSANCHHERVIVLTCVSLPGPDVVKDVFLLLSSLCPKKCLSAALPVKFCFCYPVTPWPQWGSRLTNHAAPLPLRHRIPDSTCLVFTSKVACSSVGGSPL